MLVRATAGKDRQIGFWKGVDGEENKWAVMFSELWLECNFVPRLGMQSSWKQYMSFPCLILSQISHICAVFKTCCTQPHLCQHSRVHTEVIFTKAWLFGLETKWSFPLCKRAPVTFVEPQRTFSLSLSLPSLQHLGHPVTVLPAVHPACEPENKLVCLNSFALQRSHQHQSYASDLAF